MLQAHVDLNKPQKWLAWFALVNGALTTLTPTVLSPIFGQVLPPIAVAVYFLLGLGSLVAGYWGLRARAWAFWLLFGTFLIQIAEYRSQSFFLSFIGPLNLKFGWGWNDPPRAFNLNILAIVICFLASASAVGLTSRRGSGRHSLRRQLNSGFGSIC